MSNFAQSAWPSLFESVVESSGTIRAIDWDTYARAYDYLPIVFSEYRDNLAIVEKLVSIEVEKTPNGVLIDLGAGTGNFISHLSEKFPGWKYVHVDSNSGMNSVALAKYSRLSCKGITVVEASAQNVEFESEAADVVICINALYAMSPQMTVLSKIRRWLKPGGVFICIDFGRKQRPFDWVGTFLRDVGKRRIGFTLAVRALSSFGNVFVQAVKGVGGQTKGQYWMHSLDEFSSKIGEAGFEVSDSFVCYKGYCDGVLARKTPGPAR